MTSLTSFPRRSTSGTRSISWPFAKKTLSGNWRRNRVDSGFPFASSARTPRVPRDGSVHATRQTSHRGRLAAALLVATCVSAVATPPTLFVNGIVHTVTGPTLTNGSVRLDRERITRVDAESPSAAENVTRVDLQGAHLYPGLIAIDTVLGLVEIEGVRATRDSTEVGAFRPDVVAWVAVHPDSDLIPVARANGFTHAEATPEGGVVSGFSSVIALAGWTNEELAVRKIAALHLEWPDFGLDPTPKEKAPNPGAWRSMEDQVRDRNVRLREIDDFFTDAETYARARRAALGDVPPIPPPAEGTPRPMSNAAFPVLPAWEGMLPVLSGRVPIVVHAHGQRSIRSAVEWAARRSLKLVIAGGRDAAAVGDLLARQRIPVAYSELHTLPERDTDPFDVQFSAPALLTKAGVRVSFAGGATRYGASNTRNLPYVAGQTVAYGLSADEALRGLTLYPAEALGLSERLGSIEPGKEATLFVADGDILDIRTQVRRMWIAGKEVSLESRHTRLYERYRNRPIGESEVPRTP